MLERPAASSGQVVLPRGFRDQIAFPSPDHEKPLSLEELGLPRRTDGANLMRVTRTLRTGRFRAVESDRSLSRDEKTANLARSSSPDSPRQERGPRRVFGQGRKALTMDEVSRLINDAVMIDIQADAGTIDRPDQTRTKNYRNGGDEMKLGHGRPSMTSVALSWLRCSQADLRERCR